MLANFSSSLVKSHELQKGPSFMRYLQREVCLTRKQSEVTDGMTFQQTRISSLVLGKKINPL